MIPGRGTALGARRPAHDQLAVRQVIPPPFKVTRRNGEANRKNMRGSIEAASTAVYSVGLARTAQPRPRAHDLRSGINQISMISRTRDHRIRGGTGPAPSNPVAVIPQASQNATSTCGDAGSFILSTPAEFFHRQRQSVGGAPEVFLGADLPVPSTRKWKGG